MCVEKKKRKKNKSSLICLDDILHLVLFTNTGL